MRKPAEYCGARANRASLVPRVARAGVVFVALIFVHGCAVFGNRTSSRPWSQISADEQREQELDTRPQGGWNPQPF
jgi:hypothetical protein